MELGAVNLSVTTCYLVRTGGKYILIDTGYAEDWDLFCKRLDAAKVSFADISHIILTHHHDDHCGLLNQITRLNPQICVVMHELAKDLLLVGSNDRTHGGGIINARVSRILALKQVYISLLTHKRVAKNRNLIFQPYAARPNDLLVRGETGLREIGIALDGKIIETPGHTVDSVSVIFDDGDCAVGDAAANFLQFAGTNYCVIFVNDLELYYQSWQKILSAGAKWIFPGHGKPFPADKLTKNIGKNKKEDMVLG